MNNFLAKNAQRFRTTLIVALTLAVITAATLVVFAVQFSESYAGEVQQKVYDASTSQAKIDTISNLAQQLTKAQSSVAHVEKIVADSKSYAYQDVIIKDLRSMAGKANVTINSFDFTDGSTAKGATAPKKSSGSLHIKTVSITLKNPVSYNNFLNFLHYIELNNTKMQISNVAISAATGENGPTGNINSESLEIEVYVR